MKKRIVSLLPSATEIICALDLQENLVGVSHECDYPLGVAELPKVTRTKIPHGLDSIDIDTLVRDQLTTDNALYSINMPELELLSPELIVTQALCDVCAVSATEVNAASKSLAGNPNVINLEPMSLGDVLDTILHLANHLGIEARGKQVISDLNKRIRRVVERTASIPMQERPTVGFLEWINPLFNAGHWTPELIQMAGGIDSFGKINEPSETIASNTLIEANPDVLFVALCGFNCDRTQQDLPLLRQIDGWHELDCVKNAKLYYTDGNAYFSRPGPRLVESLEIIAHCLHPKIHPLPSQLQPAQCFAELEPIIN